MRVLAGAIAALLVLWHGWSAFQGLMGGAWGLALLYGYAYPTQFDQSAEAVANFGSSIVYLKLLSGALGSASTLAALVGLGLIVAGVRRRFIGIVLAVAVLLDAVCIGPDVLDAYITWNFDDYVFLGRWEWLLRIGGSSSLFSLVEILRFPAAILGLLLSFAGCAGLSIAAAYLARTPR